MTPLIREIQSVGQWTASVVQLALLPSLDSLCRLPKSYMTQTVEPRMTEDYCTDNVSVGGSSENIGANPA